MRSSTLSACAFAVALLVSVPALGRLRGATGPFSGDWKIKSVGRFHPADGTKPVSFKGSASITVTEDSSGPTSNVSITGVDDSDGSPIELVGFRNGSAFYLSTPDTFTLYKQQASGYGPIKASTNEAKTFRGTGAYYFPGTGISRVTFTGKRVPI
jgi:hypothetical protein